MLTLNDEVIARTQPGMAGAGGGTTEELKSLEAFPKNSR